MNNILGFNVNGNIMSNSGTNNEDIDLSKPYKIGKINNDDVYEVWTYNFFKAWDDIDAYNNYKTIDCSNIPNFNYLYLLNCELIIDKIKNNNGDYPWETQQYRTEISSVIFNTKIGNIFTYSLAVDTKNKKISIEYTDDPDGATLSPDSLIYPMIVATHLVFSVPSEWPVK